MNKLILIALIFLLTGCPGKDGQKIGAWMPIFVDARMICFTVNKKDILTRYSVESNEGGQYNNILSSGGSSVNLTYPSTCLNKSLTKGYQYSASYNLNHVNYYYNFFIDNNGIVVNL